jgi:hypothetical protein
MRNLPPVSLFYRPSIVRDFAAEQSEIAAVVVNAVSGVVIVLASALMPQLFTIPLIVSLSILFGPLVGFAISSIYSWIAWFIGKRMGGKASRDDVYRVFAWSFLMLSVSVLFYSIILFVFRNAGQTTTIVLSILSIVLALLALRNYFSNIMHIQQFTWIKNTAYILCVFVFILVVIAYGIEFIMLFSTTYGYSIIQTTTLIMN